MKSKITYFTSLILLFNFIFPVRLAFIPGSAYLILMPVIFMFILQTLKSASKFSSRDEPVRFILIAVTVFIILFSLAVFSVVVTESNDFVVFKVLPVFLSTVIISFIMGYELAASDKKYERTVTVFFERIAIISLILSASVLLEVFFPVIKDLINSLISKSSNINFETGYRASGLASSGGAAQSFGMSLCFIFVLIGLRTLKLTFKWSIIFNASALMTLAAVFFVGRSGFMFCLLGWVIFFLETLFLSKVKVKFTMLLSLLIFTSLVVFAIDFIEPKVLDFFFGYSLELFNNFITTGELKSKSTSHLSTMYFFPEAFHFIFGGGFYAEPMHGYPLPDPGVMKVLLAFGVFGFIVFYTFASYFLFTLRKVLDRVTPKKSLLTIFLVLTFVIYEFKEPGLYQNYAFRLAVFTLFYFQFFISKNVVNNKA